MAIAARLILILVICCSALPALAQRIIYDQGRDKTAQDTQSKASDIAAGALFTKMLHNVDLQAKREADTTMAFVEQRMRAKLSNFGQWDQGTAPTIISIPNQPPVFAGCRSVACELRGLEARLNFFLAEPTMSEAEIKKKLNDLAARKQALDRELQSLKAASKTDDPLVVQTFSWLTDNGKDVIEYANKIAAFTGGAGHPVKGLSSALDKLGDGLDQMIALYASVKGIWDGYQVIRVDPASLRPPPQQTDLLLLALEAEHVQATAQIKARESMELSAALNHVETALNRLMAAGLVGSEERIEVTLQRAVNNHDRQLLRQLMDTLHEAAAAVAQLDAAGQLAALRLSDEERRHAIRRSAVNSATYDQTIQAASQRLAIYWKSGVKPSDLAQLMAYIANTAAIGAAAAK